MLFWLGHNGIYYVKVIDDSMVFLSKLENEAYRI